MLVEIVINNCKNAIDDCPEFYFETESIKDLYIHQCNQNGLVTDKKDLKELINYANKKRNEKY